MEERPLVSQVVQDILTERAASATLRAAATEARDHEIVCVVGILIILGLIILLGMAIGPDPTLGVR